MNRARALISFLATTTLLGGVGISSALAQSPEVPALSLQLGGASLQTDGSVSSALKISLMIAALSFLPAMILSMTCFTRIAVVLGMTRTALGTMSLPPNLVITGLSLFLTFAIMHPVFSAMYTQGLRPYLDGQMADEEAFEKTMAPLKKFLVHNAREKDLALFLEITKSEAPNDVEDVPLIVAVPAFVLSELHLAFQIGFLIALPFLVLDMVVSSVLTSMSMITLPPVVISLPLKLMLFVIVDGWHLIIGSLVQTYRVL
ncbi:MAG: flagellar type III secretion system pore protein FliP [Bdellovibrionota bacterium]|nr:MAG: flagellar type III secretion system pore protein FliP [Bdellovibrionota bacterium]